MVRFHDPSPGRREELGRAAIRALAETLPAVADIRRHRDMELEVIHARTVCQGREDLAALDVLGWTVVDFRSFSIATSWGASGLGRSLCGPCQSLDQDSDGFRNERWRGARRENGAPQYSTQ